MANALESLLGRIQDPALRVALSQEVAKLKQSKDFGLVFERHMPEGVALPTHPVKRGVTVKLLREPSEETWKVVSVHDETAKLMDRDGSESERKVRDLVVIRGFGEPIYPGYKMVGSVDRGGEKDPNVLINGENFYALESLLYSFEGKLDAIYIDPPYNTGARDWKYDNDYVDETDAYRHSKWLAFMERRLILARRLLNPEKSVLIVTIDEKEFLRLGLLLEQVFPDAEVQMVSAVINPRAGVARPKAFTRVDEYIFFVTLGEATIQTCRLSGEESDERVTSPIWFSLMRTGTNSARTDSPNLFYPVWITQDRKLHSVGDGIPLTTSRETVEPPEAGLVPIWPLRPDGSENTWQLGAPTLRKAFIDGTARLGTTGQRTTVSYLRNAEKKRIEAGDIEVIGRAEDGSLLLRHAEGATRVTRPKTVWSSPAHDAGLYGTQLLRSLIPNRKFPFPKSLYAVEDTLRFVIQDNPDALVLDFFAGSGTTGHAVARLNKQDGGRRRFILVTNNEVSDEEAKGMRLRGLVPGDEEWESQGIYRHITRPRIEAAFTGRRADGSKIDGDYKFCDVFPMAEGFDENVQFMELAYLDPNTVSRGQAFELIAPLLWMKAGFSGKLISDAKSDFAIHPEAHYGVLFDIQHWVDFIDAVRAHESIKHVFIITDSRAAFQQVIQELDSAIGSTMLYEDYLRNFEINLGGN